MHNKNRDMLMRYCDILAADGKAKYPMSHTWVTLMFFYKMLPHTNHTVLKESGVRTMYKTVVLSYKPIAEHMAEQIEKSANEMYEQGYELVTVSITNSAKAIVVYKKIAQKDSEKP